MRAVERIPTGWPDMLVAPNRGELLRAIHAAQRGGELGAVGPLMSGSHGMCYVRVVRLRMPRRPRALWPWLAGGAVALLAGLVAAGWWVAPMVTRAVPVAIAVPAQLALGRWLTRDRGCVVTHARR